MTALAYERVSVRFGGGGLLRRAPVHLAVDRADLAIGEGERVGIIGESGAGKTTLARLAVGLLRPTTGRVVLFGEDTSGWSARRWQTARHRVQLLFQDPRSMLNPAMSVGRLLRESARLHRPDQDPERAVREVLDAVGLPGRAAALPRELSGGERRRAGLARLLLARPRLVLADEPTAGLDAALKAEIMELLLERVGPDCALVVISHDLPVVAWATRRVVVMRGGRLVDELRADDAPGTPRHAYTRELLRSAGMDEDPLRVREASS